MSKLAKEISNILNKTLLQNGKKGTLNFVKKIKKFKTFWTKFEQITNFEII